MLFPEGWLSSLLKFHDYHEILVLFQDTQCLLVDIVNLVIVKYCPYIYDPEFKRLVECPNLNNTLHKFKGHGMCTYETSSANKM